MNYEPLNEACWSTMEVRREAMLSLIALFKNWQAWPESRIKRAVEQIAIETVRQVIAELNCLPEGIRTRCRHASDTMTALEAAQAGWDFDSIEKCARMKLREAIAVREAKYATYEAARDASWAAAEAGWGTKRLAEATRLAASAAAHAAKAAAAENSNPDDVLRRVCQLWIKAATECVDSG